MIPAAFVLPLWLFVGWIAFDAGAWALLWVLLVAIPSVLIGQLVLTLLVRARPTARAARAVSWWDVAGFAVWHALTFALGFFVAAWWLPVFLLTVAVGISCCGNCGGRRGRAWSRFAARRASPTFHRQARRPRGEKIPRSS